MRVNQLDHEPSLLCAWRKTGGLREIFFTRRYSRCVGPEIANRVSKDYFGFQLDRLCFFRLICYAMKKETPGHDGNVARRLPDDG